MRNPEEHYNPYTYQEILSVEITLTIHYKDGGQVGKGFKCIEDVAEFFKEQPTVRPHFTRSGQKQKLKAGDDLDDNF